MAIFDQDFSILVVYSFLKDAWWWYLGVTLLRWVMVFQESCKRQPDRDINEW